MLLVQKATEFPVVIKMGNDTCRIKNSQDASMFSLGMLFALEGKEIERGRE
jgi:hypothetical protein